MTSGSHTADTEAVLTRMWRDEHQAFGKAE